MKILLVVLSLVSSLTFSQAGFEMVQQIEQKGANGEINMQTTTRAEGDLMRVDVGSDMSTLINTQSKDITTLMHKQKVFLKVPNTFVQQAEKMAADHEAEYSKVAPPKATGATQKINGFACTEYTQTVGDSKMTYWLTKDLKGAAAVLEQAKAMGGFDPFKGSMKGFSSAEGFPIRLEIESPQMGKMTVTTLSIKEGNFPAADFKAPGDYKAFQMPAGAAPSQP